MNLILPTFSFCFFCFRRKDYTFYWELDNQICSHLQETNLTSVKHVRIGSKKATNNSVNYFPNATQLTIKYCFKTSDDSISSTLNCIVPLKQITKLIIDSYNFPFDQIVELIRFIPNLHTLKLDLLCINENSLKLLEQTYNFQYVSLRNKIKNLELRVRCSLEEIQLFINLFPQLEYLKTGIKRKEILQIIRYLLSKTNNRTRHLFFLCISQIPKICLRELTMLIKFENLLVDYFIKFINQDLYLWW
jgi:hypothetical protein